MAFGNRVFFAVGHRFNAAGIDTQGHQHVCSGHCTTLAQRQVVFACAAFVGMAFEYDADRIAIQESCVGLDDGLSFRRQRTAVLFKIDAALGQQVTGCADCTFSTLPLA